ncbi:N-acetylmuramoyl-L-alanine amidase [Candidatus Peregrinibacteria bacterium]|nr:N-acetylmuramoyl-L-alanine amidase [Candidatus Peregrinibacteria bacterium]
MPIQIINRRLDLHEFRDYIASYDFGVQPPDKLVIHHTWRPVKDKWAGARSIEGLKRYYDGKGWPAGPHLFVADDGIWLFSPMNKDGIHTSKLNHRSIGIEVVGDYDNEKWAGQTKYHALGVIKLLMLQLKIDRQNVFFHREVSSKTCPGTAITKDWLFSELDDFRILPRLPGKTKAIEGVASVSAYIPGLTSLDDEFMIPVWAAEAVAWVHRHQLFEIHNEEDVRDAVKFYRFYKLIKANGNQ